MHSRRVLAIAAAATLGGCNLAPPYSAPPPPVYSTYPEQQAGGDRRAIDLSWQEFFGDARLRAYVAAALANNRDLAIAAARIDQARAQFRIRNADRFPTLDASASATRSRVPLNSPGIVAGAPGTRAGEGPSAVTFNQYNAQVAVSAFELDFWGRVRNLSEAARRSYLASIEGATAFRLSLIADVAAAYLNVEAGDEGIRLARDTVRDRREGLAIAQLRLDAGVTSTVDYDQSTLLVTQAETELAELERTTAQARNQLLVLIGGPIAEPLPRGRPIADQGQFGPLDAGLPSSLLATRPDIRQAEQNLRAANANIGAARAAFFPSISLTGNYGFASSALGELFKGASQSWSFGGAVDLPIFDFGRRRGQLAFARAQQAELIAAYQLTVQQAFREVSDALVARRRYREQIVAQERTVTAQARLAEVAEQRYQQGIAIYLEVLDARRNLFSAQQQLIALRSTALQNGVTLYVALGGGQEPGASTVPPVGGGLEPIRE